MFLTIITGLHACTTSKNTGITRTYHNLTAYYNVYFNANESLKAGNRKIKKNTEDYSIILPVFKYEDPAVSGLISSEMDNAIKKCAKTIKSHSITVKPKYKAKGLSQKEKDFLSKPEYCKWIDDAYLLMGKAHFYKREFETALQTFMLNINKYSKESTKDEAMLWLAKTYVETNEFKNAEGLLLELKKIKRWDEGYAREIDLVYASMYLKQKDYTNAAQKINSVLEMKRNKKEKPRLYFILAQIYQNNAQYQLAINYYKKVIKKNMNYDITFKSKINLAEIYEKSGKNALELKGDFLKMLKDEKNTDYNDQLYYALAKIEQNQQNNTKAIEYYEKSANSKSSNKTQKVKTYFALADLYYSSGRYDRAELYYDSIGRTMESNYPDYDIVYPQTRSKKALSGNLSVIQTEDSLQQFARLPESERNKIIDAIIQEIRQKEQIAAMEKQNLNPDPNFNDDITQRNYEQTEGSNYYFYNPNSVSFGSTEFKKKWGDRKLEDNWRRRNKQSVLENQEPDEQNENISKSDTLNKEKKIANNKSRDFYLQNVPLTPEKLNASNKRIEKSYMNSAAIFSKDFNEKTNAIGQYDKLIQRYPNSEYKLEALQKIHTLYVEMPDYNMAEKYKQQIIREFPESFYAKLLSDPSYIQKIKKEHDEIEILYQTAYQRYQGKLFTEAIGYCEHGLKNFPDNNLSPKFIFLKAISYGEIGNKDLLKENLNLLLSKYPNDETTGRAKDILDLMAGRKFEEQIYFPSVDSVHHFVIIYQKDKIDINKLKFKFISLNAQQFTQDDLKILVQPFNQTEDILMVQSFKNSASAMVYYQMVILKGILSEYENLAPDYFVISNNNFNVLQKNLLIEKYQNFFGQFYLKK